MEFAKKYWKIVVVILVVLAAGFIWYAVWRESPRDYVTIAFLNVGQGDAIYIESPAHRQMLVDGGPSKEILSELRKVMPFYDRSIDVLLVTNPDRDHIAGFIDVLRTYKVSDVIEPGTKSSSETYKTLEEEVKTEGSKDEIAKRGMVIDLGAGAVMRILFPDRDVSKLKTNEGSIVAELRYGSTSVMFTGDAPNNIEEYVASLDRTNLKSDILKVGHHGSRTSANEIFFEAVSPTYAIISAGLNNKYGHPHKETTDLLDKLGIKTYETFRDGTIIARCTVATCTIQTDK